MLRYASVGNGTARSGLVWRGVVSLGAKGCGLVWRGFVLQK